MSSTFQIPTFWNRYLQNSYMSPNSFDRLHQCVSINRTATLNEEDVRRLKLLAIQAKEYQTSTFSSPSSKPSSSKSSSIASSVGSIALEKKEWLMWLKNYSVVYRLLNFACQYKNMVLPVADVLALLLQQSENKEEEKNKEEEEKKNEEEKKK